MRTGRITPILFGSFLLLSLLSFSISSNPFGLGLKGSAASDAAASIPKALSPKLLDSKGNLNVEKTAIDLHSNAPAPMKITCLTIGSRGDVQPYIALCQKLNELGHTCSIATHEKFRDWIVQSDIGFRPVAGDPEELIKHCTQNGKISPSYEMDWHGTSY
ncbi:hypothetical protein MJO29_012977 [Puccinia striiformis f. sp. tritici]|uniref:hypothetical protein n=1 Tax=Puccinia striiformis f. sp. tritici TaxID=168172 RepID=UPI002008E158|nr:hypothetical protein Pst134EA_024421 [Puccinia striiformis f. sp. tritici]KAH9453552.1 hypothetical protein Pst134EA_024421 [Puccinia striiformis f. sp. tritici]KAI7943133.1 hypothetical protein MJO29_012977 [Puccinia striiformis f. sp. tritici]